MKWILIVWLMNTNLFYVQESKEQCEISGLHLQKKQLIEEFRCSPIDKLT